MKRLMLAVLVIAAIALVVVADTNKKEIVAITPSQVRWFTPSYYTDGRQRAHLLGDSNQEGAWSLSACLNPSHQVVGCDLPAVVLQFRWLIQHISNTS